MLLQTLEQKPQISVEIHWVIESEMAKALNPLLLRASMIISCNNLEYITLISGKSKRNVVQILYIFLVSFNDHKLQQPAVLFN